MAQLIATMLARTPSQSAPMGGPNNAPASAAPASGGNPIMSAMLSTMLQGANPMLQEVLQKTGIVPAQPQQPFLRAGPVRPTVSIPPAVAATPAAAPVSVGPPRNLLQDLATTAPAETKPPALADQLPALFESQNNTLLAAMQRRRNEGQGGGVRGGR